MNTVPIESLQDTIRRSGGVISGSFIFTDTSEQRLHLVDGNTIAKTYTISTSRFGIGNKAGSFRTPPGLHRIVEKIGNAAPEKRIFRDRLDTGTDWQPGLTEDNLILTRIIRLRGMEPGKNSGPGIDTYERYIYIHGTNREDAIGTPISHGCILMRNHEIVELFNLIKEGTLVLIG